MDLQYWRIYKKLCKFQNRWKHQRTESKVDDYVYYRTHTIDCIFNTVNNIVEYISRCSIQYWSWKKYYIHAFSQNSTKIILTSNIRRNTPKQISLDTVLKLLVNHILFNIKCSKKSSILINNYKVSKRFRSKFHPNMFLNK